MMDVENSAAFPNVNVSEISPVVPHKNNNESMMRVVSNMTKRGLSVRELKHPGTDIIPMNSAV